MSEVDMEGNLIALELHPEKVSETKLLRLLPAYGEQ